MLLSPLDKPLFTHQINLSLPVKLYKQAKASVTRNQVFASSIDGVDDMIVNNHCSAGRYELFRASTLRSPKHPKREGHNMGEDCFFARQIQNYWPLTLALGSRRHLDERVTSAPMLGHLASLPKRVIIYLLSVFAARPRDQ